MVSSSLLGIKNIVHIISFVPGLSVNCPISLHAAKLRKIKCFGFFPPHHLNWKVTRKVGTMPKE